MKAVSPYAYAAVIVLAKLFSISLYVPVHGENGTLTAITAAAFSVAKLISLIPLFVVHRRDESARHSKASYIFCVAAAALFLLVTVSSFATVLETVYPERFSQAGVTAVIFIVFAYVASMDIHSLSRASSILACAFAAILVLIFAAMHSGVQLCRLNLYSENLPNECISTVKNLSAYMVDYFVFYGLMPYLKGSPKKAAGIYIIFEIIFSLIFFLTGSAVMGDFWSKSGYSFYTLSYTAQGSMISRSDGIILAISSACIVVCGAALMIILKDSLRAVFAVRDNVLTLTISAVVLTAVSLALINADMNIRYCTFALSVISAAVLFIGSIIAMVGGRKKA